MYWPTDSLYNPIDKTVFIFKYFYSSSISGMKESMNSSDAQWRYRLKIQSYTSSISIYTKRRIEKIIRYRTIESALTAFQFQRISTSSDPNRQNITFASHFSSPSQHFPASSAIFHRVKQIILSSRAENSKSRSENANTRDAKKGAE